MSLALWIAIGLALLIPILAAAAQKKKNND